MLLVAGAAHASDNLHPADAFDIDSAAKRAVVDSLVKTSAPVKKGDAYEVDVLVDGKKCTVLVKPYAPSKIEPPIRWKAEKPVCGK